MIMLLKIEMREIMKKWLKVTMCLFALCCLSGCGKKEEGVDGVDISAIDSVKVESFRALNSEDLILKVTNVSDDYISALNVNVSYTNKENEKETVTQLITDLRSKDEKYVSVMLPTDDNFNVYMPDDYKVEATTDGTESVVDDTAFYGTISYSVDFEEEDVLNVSLRNTSGSTLGVVEGTLVYFKDGTPVASENVIVLDMEEAFDESFYLPTKSDNIEELVDYDEYKFYLTNITSQVEESDVEDLFNP